MAGRDGTGPLGFGPLTGGRRGHCAGAVPAPGRGMGLGMGGGRGGYGHRNQFYATGLTGWQRAAQAQAAQPQAAAVQSEAESLVRIESALADVVERLERLEGTGQV